VTPVAYAVHRSVKIVDGRPPEASFELLAGATAHDKLGIPASALAVGRTIRFENAIWTIVGRFEARGSLIESELWAIEQDLFTKLRRRSHSFVVARFESPEAVAEATKQFDKAGAMERYFKGWPEVAYYREFMDGLAWVQWLAAFMVVAIVIAGALIGINTMYSAVVNRLSEIGTQRVLGFSSFDIASSLVVEGAAMALIGGIAGVVAGLLVNNVPIVFSQGAFYLVVDTGVAVSGLALALGIGVFGSLLPASKGLRLTVVEALRHG
jgi:ABC-type lipoprotein release transport system permease subunit